MSEKILLGTKGQNPHPPTKDRSLLQLVPIFGDSVFSIFRLQHRILVAGIFLVGEVLELCSKVGLMKEGILQHHLEQ